MIYTAIDTFYLSPSQLEDSPSRKDGIDEETETTLRIYGSELIQEAGILLKLPQVVMATGQVLFHRFFSKQSFSRYNVKRVAASCVWLATKLEESPRRIRDILFVFQRINQRREGLPLQPLEQFSQAYDEQRTELIRMERHLLKEMGFICHVEHPHKFIPIYMKQLGIHDFNVQQEAWSLANDSLRTTLCVRFKSEVVACGVIYAATRRARIPLPESPAWWLIFDATKPQIDDVCRALADLYARPKAVYVEVGKSHSSILSSRAWESSEQKVAAKATTPPPAGDAVVMQAKEGAPCADGEPGAAEEVVEAGDQGGMSEGALTSKSAIEPNIGEIEAAVIPSAGKKAADVERTSPNSAEVADESATVSQVVSSGIANGRRKRVLQGSGSELEENRAREDRGGEQGEKQAVDEHSGGEPSEEDIDTARQVKRIRKEEEKVRGSSAELEEEEEEEELRSVEEEDGMRQRGRIVKKDDRRRELEGNGHGSQKVREYADEVLERGDDGLLTADIAKRPRVENGLKGRAVDDEELEDRSDDEYDREWSKKRPREGENEKRPGSSRDRDYLYDKRDRTQGRDPMNGRNGMYPGDKEAYALEKAYPRDSSRGRDGRETRLGRDDKDDYDARESRSGRGRREAYDSREYWD